MEESAKDYSSSDLNDDAAGARESASREGSRAADAAPGRADGGMDGLDGMDQIVEEDEGTGGR